MLVKADPGTEKYVAWARHKATQLAELARDLKISSMRKSYLVAGALIFIKTSPTGDHFIRITGGGADWAGVDGTLTPVQNLWSWTDVAATSSVAKLPSGVAPADVSYVAPVSDARGATSAWILTTKSPAHYLLRNASVTKPGLSAAANLETGVFGGSLVRYPGSLAANRFLRSDGKIQTIGVPETASAVYPTWSLADFSTRWAAQVTAGFGTIGSSRAVGFQRGRLGGKPQLHAWGSIRSNVFNSLTDLAAQAYTYYERYDLDDLVASGAAPVAEQTLYSYQNSFRTGVCLEPTFSAAGHTSLAGSAQNPTFDAVGGGVTYSGNDGALSVFGVQAMANGGPLVGIPSAFTTIGAMHGYYGNIQLSVPGAAAPVTVFADTTGPYAYGYWPLVRQVRVEDDVYTFLLSVSIKPELLFNGTNYNLTGVNTYTWSRRVWLNGTELAGAASTQTRTYRDAFHGGSLDSWSDTTPVEWLIPLDGVRTSTGDLFCGVSVQQSLQSRAAGGANVPRSLFPAVFSADGSTRQVYSSFRYNVNLESALPRTFASNTFASVSPDPLTVQSYFARHHDKAYFVFSRLPFAVNAYDSSWFVPVAKLATASPVQVGSIVLSGRVPENLPNPVA